VEFGFTQDEENILKEVKKFIESESTPELIAETLAIGGCYGGELGRKFIKKFAANGWLTSNWPIEYGGLGASAVANFAIREEMAYARVPLAFVAAHMAGPTIMHFGSEEMKQKWLLPIARGEVEFALGYTETQAGSDLSLIQIRAEDKGDHFIVNGQKMFNTHAHVADFHWLAACTDPQAKRYRGVSLLIVDLKSPGITVRPMITMAGWRTNEVFYDDVVVPKENMVGEINQGFYYTMAALDYERMFPLGSYYRLFDDIVKYVRETKLNGHPLSQNPIIRNRLAELKIEIEASKLLYYRLAHMLDKGEIPNYQTSMQKTFATELGQRITKTGMDILGLYGQLRKGDRWAKLAGEVEFYYRWSVVDTIYAGTSEIQRNIIAIRGLNLPRK
jgi:3-oxocholest-4-en-26-oyl-CoA dehydrogenase alpha subunit